MKYGFHPDALTEYSQAALYYEDRRPGLGADFVFQVEVAVQKIVDHPTRWRCVEEDVRRCLTHTFPYAIYYTIEGDFILIVAVAHLSREPGHWKDRRKTSA